MPRVHSTIGCAMRSSPGSDPYASASETPVRELSRRATAPISHPPSIAPIAAADARPESSLAACAATPPILVARSRSPRISETVARYQPRVAAAQDHLWTFGTGSVVGRLLHLRWPSINVVITPIDPK